MILDYDILQSDVIRIRCAEQCDASAIQRNVEFIESEIDRLQPSPVSHIIFNATNEGAQEDILTAIITTLEKVSHKLQGATPRVIVLSGAWNCNKTHSEINQFLNLYEKIGYELNVIPVGYWSAMSHNNINTSLPPAKKTRKFNFLCYNMAARWHRTAIVSCLKSIDASMIYSHYNPDIEFDTTPYGNFTIDKEVKKLDYGESYGYNQINYEHHAETNLSIITETSFDEHSIIGILITEKTVRTMLARHPFILVSKSFSLQSLREQGFKTFDGIIDESYDLIDNPVERMAKICNEIKRLNNFTEEQWVEFREQTREITDHNFKKLESLMVNDDSGDIKYSEITGIKRYE